jgi:hypothetical protein
LFSTNRAFISVATYSVHDMTESSVALTVLNPLASTDCVVFISLALTVQDSLPRTTLGSANSLRNCNTTNFLVLVFKMPKAPSAVSYSDVDGQSIARQRLSKYVKTHETIEVRVFIARC